VETKNRPAACRRLEEGTVKHSSNQSTKGNRVHLQGYSGSFNGERIEGKLETNGGLEIFKAYYSTAP